ncbi:MAG: hypothetical protein JSV61_15430 [Anaerolineales bacterium]|nr:MAG: hypothetical protein JSV61_15430 [Anaerolineales bacterium]
MTHQQKSVSDLTWLPLPPHYDPKQIENVWRVPYQERAQQASEWSARHTIRSAAEDQLKINLILVDLQNTFCLPEFELFVAGRSGMGAVEDNQRLCEFIYRNLGVITRITLTMDTHRVAQIFHPIYLVDENGSHPQPLTLVKYHDIESGRWRFNPSLADSLGVSPQEGQQQLLHYTRELQAKEKYDLTIWPYHAMLGGIGHALVSAVEEAVFFHTIARQSQPTYILKGQLASTESYSAIGPEVLYGADGKQLASKDLTMLKSVIANDLVVIAGQAKSHCVVWTVEDLLEQIKEQDPQLAGKVYLLDDCSSPVVVPDIVDYTEQADQAYHRFQEAGIHLVRSTDPISSWPGL